jgi:dihydroorotase
MNAARPDVPRASEPLVHREQPPADLLIRAAHVLDPRAGIDAPHDVLVRDGAIAQLGAPGSLEAPEGAELIEGEGRHLFPGFVDPHVHLRVPGQEHKEDLDSGTRAAAAGGFVAVVAMPNTDPVVDDATVLRSLREAARREARVPVGFLASVTRGLAGEALTEMAELADAGALGFTDDGRPVHRAAILRRALQYQRLCGRVLALHEEDPSLSGAGAMHEGEVSARLGLAGIPSISESTMIARDAAIAGYEDGRIHIQHLSARESVAAVAEAKARGVERNGEATAGGEASGRDRKREARGRITAEVSPHHLTLTHEAILERLDTRLKMNPPLRSEADRRALVDGLRDGTIDCIATDHAPHAREEKEVPFEEAPMGTTGLETAFAAVYTELVVPGVLPLALVVDKLSAAAALLGLTTPRIAAGEPAAMCLADLDAEWQVGESGYESRAENCCFAGRTLRGRVLATVAAGAVVYRERAFALSAA